MITSWRHESVPAYQEPFASFFVVFVALNGIVLRRKRLLLRSSGFRGFLGVRHVLCRLTPVVLLETLYRREALHNFLDRQRDHVPETFGMERNDTHTVETAKNLEYATIGQSKNDA